MKILHCIQGLSLAAGGPTLIAASLAAAQRRAGHDVRLAVVESETGYKDVARLIEITPNFEQVQIDWITPNTNRLARLFRASQPVCDLVDWADVVHLHSVWDGLVLEVGVACRQASKPYLVLLNGMLDPWSLAQSKWKKKLALSVIVRRHLNSAAALHIGNADEERFVLRLGLKPDRVILPNGVFFSEIDRPLVGPSFVERFQGLTQGDRYILFLSRLHYKKGLDILAEAFGLAANRLLGVKLVVAGPDGGAKTDFEKRITELGIADKVLITGPLYGEDKHAAFLSCDCYCLPSRQEGFSVAITECLAYGRPLVITEGCHFPEVESSGSGRVVPLDPAKVAEALVGIMSSDIKREQMGLKGRSYAEDNLSWIVIAEKLIENYRRYL